MIPRAVLPKPPMLTDAQLVQYAADFRAGILDGGEPRLMCFAICAPLQGFLSFDAGIKTDLVESDLGDINHIWLRLPDGRALDPTADQFGDDLPPVYLGPPLAIHRAPQRWPQKLT